MKIASSIRKIYENRKPLYEELKQEVDDIILSTKEAKWHYESRVKSIDSFSLKSESGRFLKISEMEDFFAASLVVPNSTHLTSAKKS
jgi:hypothetical protein